MEVYNAAIGLRLRQGAPLAKFSIDRKCVLEPALDTEKDQIQGLVCLLCGCIYPRREGGIKQAINWYKPLQTGNSFFCYDAKATKSCFSVDSYSVKYGKDPLHYFNLSRHMEEVDHWFVDVPSCSETLRVTGPSHHK